MTIALILISLLCIVLFAMLLNKRDECEAVRKSYQRERDKIALLEQELRLGAKITANTFSVNIESKRLLRTVEEWSLSSALGIMLQIKQQRDKENVTRGGNEL